MVTTVVSSPTRNRLKQHTARTIVRSRLTSSGTVADT